MQARTLRTNASDPAPADFPEADPEFTALVPPILESIHAAMVGLALRRVVFGEDLTEKQVLETVEEMTRLLIREQ